MVALLDSEPGSGVEKTSVASRMRKGDHRVQISCEEIQNLFFDENLPNPDDVDPQKRGQQRAEQRERVRRAARRAVVFGLTSDRDIAPSGSTELPNSEKMAGSARGGIPKPEEQCLRLCEAVVDGVVVEPSFAKGDWCIRWRD